MSSLYYILFTWRLPLYLCLFRSFSGASTRASNVELSDLYQTYLLPSVNVSLLESDSPSSADYSLSRHNRFKFDFRGFCVSFAKSMIDFRSFGIGIKIPVSSNFLEYDKCEYLPRIGSFAGISFPFNYKWSVSASLPLNVVTQGLLRAARGTNSTDMSLVEKIIESNDLSVHRLGISWTLRYNHFHGYRSSYSLWMQFLSWKQILAVALPVLAIFPSALVTAFLFNTRSLVASDIPVNLAIIEVTNSSTTPLRNISSNEGTIPPRVAGGAVDFLSDEKVEAKKKKSRSRKHSAFQKKASKLQGDFRRCHKYIIDFAKEKSAVLRYNYGLLKKDCEDVCFRPTLVLDMQPFYFFSEVPNNIRDGAMSASKSWRRLYKYLRRQLKTLLRGFSSSFESIAKNTPKHALI